MSYSKLAIVDGVATLAKTLTCDAPGDAVCTEPVEFEFVFAADDALAAHACEAHGERLSAALVDSPSLGIVRRMLWH